MMLLLYLRYQPFHFPVLNIRIASTSQESIPINYQVICNYMFPYAIVWYLLVYTVHVKCYGLGREVSS
jgi:hypothetical protein